MLICVGAMIICLVYFSVTTIPMFSHFCGNSAKAYLHFWGATEQLVVCLTCSVCKRRPVVRLWTDVFSMVSMRNAQWLWNCSLSAVCIRPVGSHTTRSPRFKSQRFKCLAYSVLWKKKKRIKTKRKSTQVIAVCCFIIGSTCGNKKEADVNESEMELLNEFKAHCQGM